MTGAPPGVLRGLRNRWGGDGESGRGERNPGRRRRWRSRRRSRPLRYQEGARCGREDLGPASAPSSPRGVGPSRGRSGGRRARAGGPWRRGSSAGSRHHRGARRAASRTDGPRGVDGSHIHVSSSAGLARRCADAPLPPSRAPGARRGGSRAECPSRGRSSGAAAPRARPHGLAGAPGPRVGPASAVRRRRAREAEGRPADPEPRGPAAGGEEARGRGRAREAEVEMKGPAPRPRRRSGGRRGPAPAGGARCEPARRRRSERPRRGGGGGGGTRPALTPADASRRLNPAQRVAPPARPAPPGARDPSTGPWPRAPADQLGRARRGPSSGPAAAPRARAAPAGEVPADVGRPAPARRRPDPPLKVFDEKDSDLGGSGGGRVRTRVRPRACARARRARRAPGTGLPSRWRASDPLLRCDGRTRVQDGSSPRPGLGPSREGQSRWRRGWGRSQGSRVKGRDDLVLSIDCRHRHLRDPFEGSRRGYNRH